MILDKSKVLVVYNSDDATGDSQEVAEYYAAQRGLSHVLGLSLGTFGTIAYASMPAFRSGPLTTAMNYMDANDIEGVILSINCPFFVQTTNVNGGNHLDKASLAHAFGSCWTIVPTADVHPYCAVERTYRLMDRVDGTLVGDKTSWQRVHGAAKDYGRWGMAYRDGLPVMDWRDAGTMPTPALLVKTIPSGRLGRHEGFSDDKALAMQCVDDAVWFEEHGDPSQMPFLFGFYSRFPTTSYLDYAHVYGAYLHLKDKVGRVHTYEGNFADDTGNYDLKNWDFDKPPITIEDQVTWLNGGGPTIDLWGWLGTGLKNDVQDGFLPSVNFLRGSWMFESTSSSTSRHALGAGACAAVCPVTEPSTAGLPEISGMAMLLMKGYSMMEAVMCAQPPDSGNVYSRYTEAWGDPLYSPLMKLGWGPKCAAGAAE